MFGDKKFKVLSFEFKVQGSGFRIQGSKFKTVRSIEYPVSSTKIKNPESSIPVRPGCPGEQ
jgi:hypothetical protein